MHIVAKSITELHKLCIKEIRNVLMSVPGSDNKHVFHDSAQLVVSHPCLEENPIQYNGHQFIYSGNEKEYFSEQEHYNQLITTTDIENLIACLQTDTNSKKAYINLWDNTYIFGASGEIPCMTGIHFYIENEKLHMVCHMRSNEVLRLCVFVLQY